jgi:chemotaxis regulatin CheY-phosphate phosphatase CheZ
MSSTGDLQTRIQKEILELASSINDIVQKFKELKNPLAESHERVPRATEQLDKIDEQTQAATHQMLDKVEEISQREEELIQGLANIKDLISKDQVADVGSLVDTLIEKANATVNDVYTIMDALQFQDITSQQMNHAASLLEEVEGKLNGIIDVLQGSQSLSDPKESEKKTKPRVFDPHADMSDKKTDQSEVDSLISRSNNT